MTINRELAEFCGICWHDEVYPDFSGKDFHLLHTAMREKGRWYDLYFWLYAGKIVSGTSPAYCGLYLQQLPFPEQVKIINGFIKEYV